MCPSIVEELTNTEHTGITVATAVVLRPQLTIRASSRSVAWAKCTIMAVLECAGRLHGDKLHKQLKRRRLSS